MSQEIDTFMPKIKQYTDAEIQDKLYMFVNYLKGLCKVKSLHLHRAEILKNISFKSNLHLHTESTKDSATIRFLSRHETMLCRSNFFVLFIEEPIYHCTLALIEELFQ